MNMPEYLRHVYINTDEIRKHIAIVFLVLASFLEYSVLGTLIRKSRNASMNDVTIAMINDSSILKTRLATLDIRSID